ncbi:MAG: recombinase RecT, partial [Paraclostridium sp.]
MSNLKEELKKKEANKIENLSINPNYAMKQLMVKMKSDIKDALPSHICVESFQKSALSVYSSDVNLQGCESITFIGAMLECARLGLEPNNVLGQAYLVPVNVDGVSKVEFQLGYKGMIELAYRSGRVKSLYAHEVMENDEFYIDYGL